MSLYCRAKAILSMLSQMSRPAWSNAPCLEYDVARKAFSTQDGLHRVDVLPVYIDEPISICPKGQLSSEVKNTARRM